MSSFHCNSKHTIPFPRNLLGVTTCRPAGLANMKANHRVSRLSKTGCTGGGGSMYLFFANETGSWSFPTTFCTTAANAALVPRAHTKIKRLATIVALLPLSVPASSFALFLFFPLLFLPIPVPYSALLHCLDHVYRGSIPSSSGKRAQWHGE